MIASHEDWLKEYRKDRYKTWIKATLSNNEIRYFHDYSDWKILKELCQNQSLDIVELGLQRKSNYVGIDTRQCRGVYLVRSVLGMMGQEPIHTFTIGKIIDNSIHKQVYLIPELIEHRKEVDDIEKCFEEAILYHNVERKTKTI